MYGLKQNSVAANSHYENYKEKVHCAIKARKTWWIVKKRKYAYLKKEGNAANVFFEKCLRDDDYLKRMICGTPEELLDYVQDFMAKEGMAYFEEQKVKVEKKLEETERNILEKVESVEVKQKAGALLTDEEKDLICERDRLLCTKAIDDFNRSLFKVFVDELYGKLDKKKFVKNLNLRICPYYGRNYIFNVDRKEKTIKPQIDHFLPKGQFPFLAISYYNLIPSCTVCNLDVKGETVPLNDTFTAYSIPHPYSYSDEWKFIFKLNGIDIFSNFASGREDNIEIAYEGDLKVLDAHEELFAIKSLYGQHNDLIHELIIRKQFWTSESIQQYYKNILETKYELGPKMTLAILGYSENSNEKGKYPFMKLLKEVSDYYDKLVKKGKSII